MPTDLDARPPTAPAGTRARRAPCSRRTSGRRAPRATRRSPAARRASRAAPRGRAPSRAAGARRRDARSACRSRSSRARSAPRPRSRATTRYCVSGAKLGANHGRHCASGPPCTVTTTGNGPSPSGSNRNTGIDSPSKLSKRCSSARRAAPARRRAGSPSAAAGRELDVVHVDVVRLGRATRTRTRGASRPGRRPAPRRRRAGSGTSSRSASVLRVAQLEPRAAVLVREHEQRAARRRRAARRDPSATRAPSAMSGRRGRSADRERVAPLVRRGEEAEESGSHAGAPYSASPSCGVTCSTSPLSTSKRKRSESPRARRAAAPRPAAVRREIARLPPAAELERPLLAARRASRTTTSKSTPLRRFVAYASSAPSRLTCGERWMKRGSTTSGSGSAPGSRRAGTAASARSRPRRSRAGPARPAGTAPHRLREVRQLLSAPPRGGDERRAARPRQVGADEQRRAVGGERERRRLPQLEQRPQLDTQLRRDARERRG